MFERLVCCTFFIVKPVAENVWDPHRGAGFRRCLRSGGDSHDPIAIKVRYPYRNAIALAVSLPPSADSVRDGERDSFVGVHSFVNSLWRPYLHQHKVKYRNPVADLKHACNGHPQPNCDPVTLGLAHGFSVCDHRKRDIFLDANTHRIRHLVSRWSLLSVKLAKIAVIM